MRLKFGIIFTLLVVVFSGCFGDKNNTDKNPGDIAVTGLNINKLNTSIQAGSTEQLFANVTPSNATNKKVSWSSDDDSIATVSLTGLVSAISSGIVHISAVTEDGDFSSECIVSVVDMLISVTGINLDEDSVTINMGSTKQLYATILPADATNQSLTWSSSNSSVATVSSSGVITPVNTGNTTISVTTADGGHTDNCVVIVEARVTGVSINKSSTNIHVGNTEQLSASVSPINALNKEVTWASSDISKATVNSTGIVTAVSSGTATITVTTDESGFTDECVVTMTVLQVDVTGINLNKSKVCLNVGFTEQLTAEFIPVNATNQNLTWTSSNESVATVNASGLVTAVALGTTTIMVTAEDGGFNSSCEVTVKPPFITTWKTDAVEAESTNAYQIKLPLDYDGFYNFQVNWGDGSSDQINLYYQSEICHTYATSGIYNISITGTCEGFGFSESFSDDDIKILDVKSWGGVKLHNKGGQFGHCENLTGFSATDIPDLSNITDMNGMFYYAKKFNSDLNLWEVKNVTNMSFMFSFAESFNGDLSTWDVSSVTDMSYMFYNAIVFNRNLSLWNVNNVTKMNGMFYSADLFNSDVSAWNVSNVVNMNSMFRSADAFNHNLNKWDVSKVSNMNYLFNNAKSFNGDISTWNVSNVENMSYMFSYASQFNGDISTWNVIKVINMCGMFSSTDLFNNDISKWDVSKVVDMSGMFSNSISFNKDISKWDVSNVVNMSCMFRSTKAFNQDLKIWNVGKVQNMSEMFSYSVLFNGDITSWDVNNVTNMSKMFYRATSFNQNLNSWDVSNVSDISYMFIDSGLQGNEPTWYH